MGPRTRALCMIRRQREPRSVEDFADAPQEVLGEQKSHRVIRWFNPSYFCHTAILIVPLAGCATATVRLSLRSETKATEHAYQLVGGHPRLRPDNAKTALTDQIISLGTPRNRRVTISNANKRLEREHRMFFICRGPPVTWASVFRVASCPERILIVVPVHYGMPSALQLILDNCAHLLKHCLQRYSRLRFLLDPCYVDQQEVRSLLYASP